MENFNYDEFYVKEIPSAPEEIASFIEKIITLFPQAEVQFDKFDKSDSGNRTRVENIEFSQFLTALRASKKIGSASIQRVNQMGYLNKSGIDQSILEFMVRDVVINEEEHCVWIKIPDNPENRSLIETSISDSQ